ncbi:hypothetical protein COHA_000801 [Chlorella ohadii]|uniref:Major facilitator superfamily (MFS) profile domain-containing protein n=1 Tax=Chlorella ohadii TaxID=2649997 RepID=A0AAD5DWE2_9CHLO|nr:hypothetical protein COHA_000801 [Chlorella ohadii]
MEGSMMQSRGSIEKRAVAAGAIGGSAAAEDEPVHAAAVQRKLDRHLIPWLFSLGVLCYLDRTNLSFAALELNRDLSLSCATYGLGASLFFVSYAVFQMPSTVACARLGAPTWLGLNIIAWGLVAASFALATSVPVFLTLRFLLGTTEAAAFPGMYQHLSLFYNERQLGPAYAKVASCTALAQVVGAPIAAAILAMDGAGGLKGWQWLFLLEGAATVVFGMVLRLCLAPSPAKARMLSHEEREWLQQEQDAARAATAAASGAATMAALPLALRLAGPGLAFALLSLACGFCWSFHGPFFSWPAVFLPGEQASIGFSFINSMGAVGGFIGPWMLGLLTSRQDGGLAPAFLALAAFLAAAGTGLLLFPAPGRLAAASLELKGGYAGDGSELDGLAAGEQSDKGGLENGEAAEQRRLWQGRQQQHSQHEVECQPILPGGSSNHS